MIIDEQRKEQILGVFKTVYEYRELAKEHGATARENMKALAESFTSNKEELKTVKKALNKAFKEWIESIEGHPENLPDAIEIVEAIKA